MDLTRPAVGHRASPGVGSAKRLGKVRQCSGWLHVFEVRASRGDTLNDHGAVCGGGAKDGHLIVEGDEIEGRFDSLGIVVQQAAIAE